MRNAILIGGWLGLCVVGGCQEQKVATDGSFARSGGLEMSLAVPRQTYAVGESFDATVTVRNVTKQPIAIRARTGCPAYIHVLRPTPAGEDLFKTYPESQTMVMNEWTIRPGETRTFTLTLTVGPDWPRNERLRLVAELNGHPKLAPWKPVTVQPRPTQ